MARCPLAALAQKPYGVAPTFAKTSNFFRALATLFPQEPSNRRTAFSNFCRTLSYTCAMSKPLVLETENPKKLYSQLHKGGLELIQSLKNIQATESEILDFKLAKNNGIPLEFEDRVNLSKSISGFANSQGGVLVWGVYCNENDQKIDCVIDLKPIANLKAFASALTNATTQVVTPPVREIRHHLIFQDHESGYLVMLIPKSKDVIQSITKKGKGFYERIGSSFIEMSDDRLTFLAQASFRESSFRFQFRGYAFLFILTATCIVFGGVGYSIGYKNGITTFGETFERRFAEKYKDYIFVKKPRASDSLKNDKNK